MLQRGAAAAASWPVLHPRIARCAQNPCVPRAIVMMVNSSTFPTLLGTGRCLESAHYVSLDLE